jgi:hypothetical protein
MATIIKDILTFDLALNLINQNKVISKKKARWDNRVQSYSFSDNIIQIYKNNNKIEIKKFNFYGQKTEQYIVEDINEIKRYLDIRDNQKWFFHTKREAKKKYNKDIVDEFEAKKIVYRWLLNKYKEAVIIPEIKLGERRVDYLVLNKNIITVEIKSEIDTLDRLEAQIEEYLKYSNYIIIVAHSNKINKIEQLITDKNIGLFEITQNGKLKFIRQPKKMKKNYLAFLPFISYQEYIDMKKGLKWNSKFDKYDIENIFKILKTRYIKESSLRKKLFKNKDYKSALGSATNIWVNRLINNNTIPFLKSFFNLDNDFLIKYIKK